MGAVPVFASADEALEMVRAGLGYLAATDATQLGSAAQARCLKVFEQADAIATAARASFLAAFTAGQGLQRPGVADPPDAHHQGRGGRAYRVG